MKQKDHRAGVRLLTLLGCLALAACGGGGDNGNGNGGSSNAKPTANAGEPQTVDAGVVVTLEGTGSDSDGQIAGYAWTQTDGPEVTLEAGDDGKATFTAPSVQAAGELAFELTVTDDDGESASDDVAVTVAPVIAMSGRVYDGPLAGANVTITVGERSYTAVADEDGNYTVNIGSIDPDAFITITATGGEGQENVELVSIAASFASLQSAAGEDGVLEDSESGSVDVTNLSTAKAVLMIEANGGQPIISDDVAAEAEKNVNGDEMIRLATVIKLVVDGGFDLPEGVNSTLDLVDDTDTAESFIETVNTLDPGAFQATQDAMLSDPELVDAFDASDVPPVYTLVLVDTYKSTGTPEYQFGRGERYEFNADGTGSLYGSSESVSGSFAWQVVNGQIAMTFDAPLISEGFCVPEGDVLQIYCVTEVTQAYLGLILDGSHADQLQFRQVGHRTYPDNPELPGVDVDESSNQLAYAASAEIPFANDEVIGTWAFSVAGPELTGLAHADVASGVLQFNADGSGKTLATTFSPALAFTWTLGDDGELRADFDDGSALVARRFRKDGIGFDTQFLFETAAGTLFSSANLIVKSDDTMSPAKMEEATGFFTLYDEYPYFSIILKNDGTAINRNYDLDGNPVDQGITWEINADGHVAMSYYWNVDLNQPVDSCDGYEEWACFVWRQRIWMPIAFDEAYDRVFVRETQVNYDYDDMAPGNRGPANFVQTTVRYWGDSETSLDDDVVLGKAGAPEAERRRSPWMKLPFGTHIDDE